MARQNNRQNQTAARKGKTLPKAAIRKLNPTASQPTATPKMPAPLKPNEIINRDELKEAIEASLKRQIVFYAPNGPIVTNEGIEKGARRDGTEMPDTMDVNNWLEWQHVYGAIPILVAERQHLRDNVGVFPPYNLNRMKELLESRVTTKLIKDAGLATRVTANGDTILDEPPLPSLSTLTERGKVLRNNEEKRRNEAERQRYAKAKEILEKNNLSEEKAFELYLEALGESKENFLGNPYKKDLSIDECTQFIIPFNFNNSHFAVSVVKFEKEGDKKIAIIKHYDSMGSDLRETLKSQLISYCAGLGFEPRYQCVSQRDQRYDGYNCGIFACFKAIDIANENANNPERLLDNLRYDNYHQIMDSLRYVISLKLREFGINVSSSAHLTGRLKQQQENFARASVQSQQIGMLNALLWEVKNQLESGLAECKGENPKQNTAEIPFPDMQSRNLFNECMSLFNQALTQLQVLEQKQDKTAEEVAKYNRLQGRVDMFRTVAADLSTQVGVIERRNQSILSRLGLNSLSNWIAAQNWQTLALALPLGCLAFLLGIPVMGSLLLAIGGFLVANLGLSFMVGGGIVSAFAAGGAVSYFLSNLLTDEDSYNQQRQQYYDEEEIPELLPTAHTGAAIGTEIEDKLAACRRQLEETIAAIPALPATAAANESSTAAPILITPTLGAGDSRADAGNAGPKDDRRITRSQSKLLALHK